MPIWLSSIPQRAFIFDRTGKVVKRHEGVHREFTRLTKDEPGIDKSVPPFLTQAYNMKAIPDYDIAGRRPETVKLETRPLAAGNSNYTTRKNCLPRRSMRSGKKKSPLR